MKTIGLDPIGLEPIGLEPIGLEPIGLDPIDLETIGLIPIGLNGDRFEPHMICLFILISMHSPVIELLVFLHWRNISVTLCHSLVS